MNRAETIEKLIKEGFSEKTLVKFNDNQLKKFAAKILKEAESVLNIPAANKPAIDLARKNKQQFVTYSEEMDIEAKESSKKKANKKSPKSDDGQTDEELYNALSDMGWNYGEYGSEDFDDDGFAEAAMNLGYRWNEKNKKWYNRDTNESIKFKEVKEDEVISVGQLRKSKKVKPVFKNLHEFVENTINSNYHSLVTKGDMVSLVKEKINESSDLYEKEMIDHLPEFMNEFDMAQPDVKPDVKPAPSKPDTDRPTREKPRHPGQRPQDPKKQPLPNPVPKAKAKEISGEEAKSRVINMINKIFSNN
jgi:hypothetical protein